DVWLDGSRYADLDANALAELRNGKLGFVFQFHHLLREFSALENVMMPLLIGGTAGRRARSRAEQLLSLVGLAGRMTHRPAELSGGEQQRCAVARALVHDPSLVLADEPSGNLDHANSDRLHEVFFRLAREYETAVVVVTHNRQLAGRADRILLLDDGRLAVARCATSARRAGWGARNATKRSPHTCATCCVASTARVSTWASATSPPASTTGTRNASCWTCGSSSARPWRTRTSSWRPSCGIAFGCWNDRPGPPARRGMHWLDASGPKSSIVLSTRIRLARNLQGYVFGQRARDNDRTAILTRVEEAAAAGERLRGAVTFRLDQMERPDRQLLHERHLVSKELAGL